MEIIQTENNDNNLNNQQAPEEKQFTFFKDSAFRKTAPVGLKLFLFLFGFLGFQFIGFFLSIFFSAVTDTIFAEALLNFVAYFITTLGMLLFLFLYKKGYYLKLIFSGFKYARVYICGLIFFGLGLLIELLFSLVNTAIVTSIYGDVNLANLNETSINNIMNSSYAFLMIIPVVLFAPIVEEFTYRLGLLDLIGKKHKITGLIVSSIVFGVIHFNGIIYILLMLLGYLDPSILSGEIAEALGVEGTVTMDYLAQQLVIEFLNLPIYILMGACLGLAYLTSGSVCGSIVAHMTNNLLSSILTIFSTSLVVPDFIYHFATLSVNSNLLNFISLIR